jgi:hypothetical protein
MIYLKTSGGHFEKREAKLKIAKLVLIENLVHIVHAPHAGAREGKA